MGGNPGNGNEPSNCVPSRQKRQRKVKQQQNTAAGGGQVAALPRQEVLQQQQHNQNQKQDHAVHPCSFDHMKRPKLEGMIPENLVYKAEEERMKALMHQRAAYEEQQKLKRSHMIQQRLFDDAACINKLHEYNYFMQKGSKENSIEYWRKFVSQFYAECGGEKWCVSSYGKTEDQISSGHSFPMERWCCSMCGAKSGKGFGGDVEILPRLLQMRFASGEIDHNWRMKNPRACKVGQNAIMIEHAAILETIYDRFRVIREGKLWVCFRNDLKILLWQFCSTGHEELFPRRIIAPMVNRFIDVANDYQKSIYDCKLGVATEQHLQDNGNSYLKHGRMLNNYVESPIINDQGFSAKHARCFEIAKIVNTMKGLIDFSLQTKTGPIESLQIYPCACGSKPLPKDSQTDRTRSMAVVQCHPAGLYNYASSNGGTVSTGSRQDSSISLYQQPATNDYCNSMLSLMSGSTSVAPETAQRSDDSGDVQVNGATSSDAGAR